MKRNAILSLFLLIALVVDATTPVSAIRRPKITAHNVAQIGRLSSLGRGFITSTAWSADGQTIAVAGNQGIWLYAAEALDKAPRLIETGKDGPRIIRFSPDDKILAYATGPTIVLWDVPAHRQRAILPGHTDNVVDMVFSPDGKMLASTAFYHRHEVGSLDDSIRVWETGTSKQVSRFDRPSDTGALPGLRFSPDGRFLIFAERWGSAFKLDLASGQINTFEFKNEQDRYPGSLFEAIVSTVSSDGRIVAVGGCPICRLAVRLLDMTTGKELPTPCQEDITGYLLPKSLAFNPEGKVLAIGTFWGAVSLWDVGSGHLKTILRKPFSGGHEVHTIAFSPDGTKLLAGDRTAVQIWDIASGNVLGTLVHHPDPRAFVFLGGTGSYLHFDNERVVLRDVADGAIVRLLPGMPTDRYVLAPDATSAVTAGSNNVILWDVATGRMRKLLDSRKSGWFHALFSVDSKLVATSTSYDDIRLKVWETVTGTKRFEIAANAGFPVQFSPDGALLMTIAYFKENWTAHGTITLWSTTTGQAYQTIPTTDFTEGVFAAGGSTLILWNRESPKGLMVWDVANGVERKRLETNPIWVRVSSNGRYLLTRTDDGYTIWLAANGEKISTIRLQSPLHELADFSPDGALLAVNAAASTGGSILVFDTVSGQLLSSIATGQQLLWHIAFDPDGTRLLTVADDGVIQTWGVTSEVF